MMTSNSVPDRAAHVLAEYEAQEPLYVAFTDRVLGLTIEILKQAGIRFHSASARVKNRDSLIGKLLRPDRSYTKLSEVTDISGIRITTYFQDDVDRVAELITRKFQVDIANSRKTKDVGRFVDTVGRIIGKRLTYSDLTGAGRGPGYDMTNGASRC